MYKHLATGTTVIVHCLHSSYIPTLRKLPFSATSHIIRLSESKRFVPDAYMYALSHRFTLPILFIVLNSPVYQPAAHW